MNTGAVSAARGADAAAVAAALAVLDEHNVIAAGPDKVHLDVQFTRYRTDGSVIGSYRSLWIVSRLDGRWAAQARSSFAE